MNNQRKIEIIAQKMGWRCYDANEAYWEKGEPSKWMTEGDKLTPAGAVDVYEHMSRTKKPATRFLFFGGLDIEMDKHNDLCTAARDAAAALWGEEDEK